MKEFFYENSDRYIAEVLTWFAIWQTYTSTPTYFEDWYARHYG